MHSLGGSSPWRHVTNSLKCLSHTKFGPEHTVDWGLFWAPTSGTAGQPPPLSGGWGVGGQVLSMAPFQEGPQSPKTLRRKKQRPVPLHVPARPRSTCLPTHSAPLHRWTPAHAGPRPFWVIVSFYWHPILFQGRDENTPLPSPLC